MGGGSTGHWNINFSVVCSTGLISAVMFSTAYCTSHLCSKGGNALFCCCILFTNNWWLFTLASLYEWSDRCLYSPELQKVSDILFLWGKIILRTLFIVCEKKLNTNKKKNEEKHTQNNSMRCKKFSNPMKSQGLLYTVVINLLSQWLFSAPAFAEPRPNG